MHGWVDPGVNDLQLIGQVLLAAQGALHLAARGDRQRRLANQHDRIRVEIMVLDDRPPNRLNDLVMIGLAELAVELVNNDQPLAAAFIGERERSARQHGRVGFLGRLLDVLRIVIAAANDDHVLHAAGDEQLALAEETQGRPCAGTCLRGPALRAPNTSSVSSGRFQ